MRVAASKVQPSGTRCWSTDMMISRILACIALGGIAWGCSAPDTPSTGDGTAARPMSVSYDGHYEGKVQFGGVASGGAPAECGIDPHLSLQVTNNSFVYVQAHPKIAGTAPSLSRQSTTVTYNATIAPDGTITGDSGDVGGRLMGRLTGTHMSGQIFGLVCDYTFVADRV